jgi:hypothetical protein
MILKGTRFEPFMTLVLQGVLNGELLSVPVAQQFDVLVTVDRRIPFQQNISQFNLALLVLVARPSVEIARAESTASPRNYQVG